MQLPKISIVTPSFNQAKYLPETIESILNQDYPNMEYIIIDGGSTDGSVDIIKRYESHLSYWGSEKDSGQSDAIMKGFDRSTGELFAWVNSDDVLFPGCLHRIASTYIRQGRPDIIHSDVAYLNSEGRIIRFVRIPAQSRFFCSKGVWYAQAPAVFFKSVFFRSVGGLNRNYYLSMDFDIWVRMMKAGAAVVHVPHYLGGFRWHDSSKTVQFLDQSEKYDNPEAIEICSLQLPGLTRSQRIFWQYILKVYRLLNLNYLRACKDSRNIGGSKRWQETFNGPSVSNNGNGTMKFLLVTPAYEPAWEYGGVVASNSNLCRAMAKLGVSVTVYTTNASKGNKPLDVPLGVPVNLGGVEVYYFKSTFGANNNFCSRVLTKKLWQTVSNFDVVYVVALWQWIGIEAARACRKMKVPMVVAIKGGFSKRLLKKSYIKKQLFWLLFLRRALQIATAKE
jgi:glycosyltransferase involved in cell wall biosynthesis